MIYLGILCKLMIWSFYTKILTPIPNSNVHLFIFIDFFHAKICKFVVIFYWKSMIFKENF